MNPREGAGRQQILKDSNMEDGLNINQLDLVPTDNTELIYHFGDKLTEEKGGMIRIAYQIVQKFPKFYDHHKYDKWKV